VTEPNQPNEPQEFAEFIIQEVIDFGLDEEHKIHRGVLVPLLVAAIRERDARVLGLKVADQEARLLALEEAVFDGDLRGRLWQLEQAAAPRPKRGKRKGGAS
jgi:hypothetical protein